jgi:hypothetical protein
MMNSKKYQVHINRKQRIKRAFPNLLYEVKIILIPKPDKYMAKKF